MKLNKFVAMFTVATLAMTTLSACGTATSKETETKAKEETTPSFSYWLQMHAQTAQSVTDLNNHPAALRLEEQTGVMVDYISPPVGQEVEQMNLLLASGEGMPDVIKYDLKARYRGGVEGAIVDKVIMDATELIEANAPNFMERISADENIRRGAYTDSGAIANFGAIIPGEEMRGLPFQGPMVNKTMLDAAGLEVPVTIADWEEMLAAFKDMGVKIPFSFGCNNRYDASFEAFSGAYGVPMGAKFMNQDGVAKFGPMEAGYKEFLMTFAKWYENGWLDPDFLSKNQNKEVRNDFDAGIMGSGILHINSVVSAPVVSIQQGNEEAVAVPAPYPVLNEGDTIHFRHFVADFNQAPTFITAEVETPETIIKWIDYLYSDEGVKEISFGTMGDERFDDTYYVDEDGTLKYSDFVEKNPNGLTSDQVHRYYMLRDTAMVWDWESQSLMYTDERQQAGWDVWGTADYDWVMPATITLTLEEADEYSKLMGDITTYVNEMTTKFIMGIESFDNYDNFVLTLEKMQIGKVIEIQQAALDRYIAR